MSQKKISEKRKFLQEEKHLDKIHSVIFLVCAGFAWYYYKFIEPETIGTDRRYFFYAFLLPTLFGMLVVGYYRRQFLVKRFILNRGFILWTFMILFYFVQGAIVSYLSFGQVAKITWDYINYSTAMGNAEEIVVCDVERFWAKRKPAIEFSFAGNHEEFRVDRSYIRQYADVNPNNFQLKIQVRRGMWNCLLVTGWNVQKKTDQE